MTAARVRNRRGTPRQRRPVLPLAHSAAWRLRPHGAFGVARRVAWRTPCRQRTRRRSAPVPWRPRCIAWGSNAGAPPRGLLGRGRHSGPTLWRSRGSNRAALSLGRSLATDEWRARPAQPAYRDGGPSARPIPRGHSPATAMRKHGRVEICRALKGLRLLSSHGPPRLADALQLVSGRRSPLSGNVGGTMFPYRRQQVRREPVRRLVPAHRWHALLGSGCRVAIPLGHRAAPARA
jgi:hypothetical protein